MKSYKTYITEMAPSTTPDESDDSGLDPLDAAQARREYERRREELRRLAFEKQERETMKSLARSGYLNDTLSGMMSSEGEKAAAANQGSMIARGIGMGVGALGFGAREVADLGRTVLNKTTGSALAGAAGIATQIPSMIRARFSKGIESVPPKPPTPPSTPPPKPPTPPSTPPTKPPTPVPPSTPPPKPPTPVPPSTPPPKPPTPPSTPPTKPPTPVPPSTPPTKPTSTSRYGNTFASATRDDRMKSPMANHLTPRRTNYAKIPTSTIRSHYEPNNSYSNLLLRLNEKCNCQKKPQKFRQNILVPPMNEQAPTNSVGSGENIAGINPPAGPAPLTGRNLKGLAAGMSPHDLAKKHGVSLSEIVKQLKMGQRVEREHTDDAATAMKIAMDHVFEDPKYYTKLQKMEQTDSERDIGNDTVFSKRDRQAKYRVFVGQTRRTTQAHPGNPGIDHA